MQWPPVDRGRSAEATSPDAAQPLRVGEKPPVRAPVNYPSGRGGAQRSPHSLKGQP